ncbi:MAG TPA: hypothetical protein VFO39_12655 [Candidatus Sulfotelmatobacter sp.]|nr:hypothetical protein [Candidatus Sulfotelmatobacter sp.]
MVTPSSRYYLISNADRPPLRVGLLLDSLGRCPSFAAKVIGDIRACNFARIELLVVNKLALNKNIAPVETAAHSALKFGTLFGHIFDARFRKRLLYDFYLKLDARKKLPDDPLAYVDCGSGLSQIEAVEVDPEGDRFPAEALEKIRAKNLDVLLRFGFTPVHREISSGDIFTAARYGVWSFHYGDPETYSGWPPYLRELRERAPFSGLALEVLGEEATRLSLANALFATEKTTSVSQNRHAPYWASTEMVLQKLLELHQFGWEHVQSRATAPAISARQSKRETPPSNRDMLSWLGPILLKKALRKPFRRRRTAHWRIATRAGATPLFDTKSESDLGGFRWLESPPGHFWADPFPFEHEGKCWAFFEDYSYASERGSLACAEVLADGSLGKSVTCLQNPQRHHSYPHVFRAGSEVYMIPESFDSNTVDLYRCCRFPDEWVREATLFEGKFVDTTIWEHDGLWWLWTTSAEPSPISGSLLLFYSRALTGKWHYHPANPISWDIRYKRGAGRIIQHQNRLIRPSQSGAPAYGYSFSFNEITELSTIRYSESPLKTILPEQCPGVTGVHTYNAAGRFEFIDGRSVLPMP